MELIRNSNWPIFRGSFLSDFLVGYESLPRAFNLPINIQKQDISAKYEEAIMRLSIAKNNEPESKLKKSIAIR